MVPVITEKKKIRKFKSGPAYYSPITRISNL